MIYGYIYYIHATYRPRQDLQTLHAAPYDVGSSLAIIMRGLSTDRTGVSATPPIAAATLPDSCACRIYATSSCRHFRRGRLRAVSRRWPRRQWPSAARRASADAGPAERCCRAAFRITRFSSGDGHDSYIGLRLCHTYTFSSHCSPQNSTRPRHVGTRVRDTSISLRFQENLYYTADTFDVTELAPSDARHDIYFGGRLIQQRRAYIRRLLRGDGVVASLFLASDMPYTRRRRECTPPHAEWASTSPSSREGSHRRYAAPLQVKH